MASPCSICLEECFGDVLRCGRCLQAVHRTCQEVWTKQRLSRGLWARCATCWSVWDHRQTYDFEAIEMELASSRAVIRACLRRILEKSLDHRSILRSPLVDAEGRTVVLVDGFSTFKTFSHLEKSFNDGLFDRFKKRWDKMVCDEETRGSVRHLFDTVHGLESGEAKFYRAQNSREDVSRQVRALLAHIVDLDTSVTKHHLLLEVYKRPLEIRDADNLQHERKRDREDREQDLSHEQRFGAFRLLTLA